MLGDHIKFKERILQVGEWTNFILLAHGQAHSEQIAFIQEKVAGLKPYISSSNASIGRLILDTYENKLDLELKVTQRVEEALKMETNKRDQI